MQVYYWTGFGKRNNSTKQPDIQDGHEIDIVLKDESSMENPVIETAQVPMNASYFHIPDFGRYYFIRERVKVTLTVTRFYLATDPLATFKTAIGGYTGLISRCSDQNFWNPYITDGLNPPDGSIDGITDFDDVPLFTPYGTYILGVVGQPPSATSAAGANGIARYYAVDAATMTALAYKLNDSSVLAQLILEFTAPLESLISCSWIPIAPTSLTLSASAERIKIGSWDSGIDAYVITGRTLNGSVTSSTTFSRGSVPKYMGRAPYESLHVYLPFVGYVPFPWDAVSQIDAGGHIEFKYFIDVFTGDLIWSIGPNLGSLIDCRYCGNISASIPVSAKTYSPTGIITNAINTIGGVASGNLMGALEGAAGVARSVMMHGQVNGSQSSGLTGAYAGLMQIRYKLYYQAPVHGATDAANVEGLPCEKVAMISNHPGYLLMRNASVDIDGTEQDRTAVNGYLNSGFFYE